MKIKDIMSTDIACVGEDDSVERAARLMQQYDVGSIPVCAHQHVIGIVTDRDIALRSVAEGQNPAQTVRDVMTYNPVTGDPQMDVDDAARLMSQHQIRRLPIVENNQLVGIVALGDISLEPGLQEEAENALKNISQPGGSSLR